MRIITPTAIEQTAWEGTLEPLAVSFGSPTAQPRVNVTLGEPAVWSAEQALAGETGKQWSPPADGKRYALVRLACTLHPLADPQARFSEARLMATLSVEGGAALIVAHDLYPLRVGADAKGTYTLKLGPELKFADAIDAKLGEVGAEIEYHKVLPVIQGIGLGERQPYWQLAHHAANPLLGSQSVYLVVAAPPNAGRVSVTIALMATIETRFGPFRVGLPDSAQADLVRRIM